MATFTGLVQKADYKQYYKDVQNNPGDFVKRVFGSAASGAEPRGVFKVGNQTFTLTLALKGNTRQLCIQRQHDEDASWLYTRVVALMDALFFRSSTRTMERALRSEATMAKALAPDMRPRAADVINELWPGMDQPNANDRPGPSDQRNNAVPANSRPISERGLGMLQPLNPGEIDAWMRCPESGPVSLKHIDRSKTRIENDVLVLSFKSGGEAIEFRLQAKRGTTLEESPRIRRDMERLLRIAKGQREGCDYRNMAELMGRFMVATIEDEAPGLLEKWAEKIVSKRKNYDARPLLACSVKGGRSEPTRATRRAIARAVEDAMESCRVSATRRFQQILTEVCRNKADPVLSTVLDARRTLVEDIQKKAKPFLAERRLAAFVRQLVRERGVDSEAAQAMHAERALGVALPTGVRLARFTRKPGLLERLFDDELRPEVLAVASRQDGDALRFVPPGQRDMAQWAWKTIKLAEVPKDVESDAKALHQTVFDSALGQFYLREIVPLVNERAEALGGGALGGDLQFEDRLEQDAARKLLLDLTANLRIGNTTFGYLHRWADEAERARGVGEAQNPHRVVVAEEDEVLSGPVAPHPISQRQAAAYALRQDLQKVVPSIANVTPADCDKPVTVYTEGKFSALSHQFAAAAPRQEDGSAPKWQQIDTGKPKNQQNQQPDPVPSEEQVPAES